MEKSILSFLIFSIKKNKNIFIFILIILIMIEYNAKGGLKMLKNKKGLSMVVTTLITILLVLVAIGIVWVVVKNVVESGSKGIDLTTKCLSVDVRAIAANSCNATQCTITINRRAGGEAIGGVKMVLSNGTDTSEVITIKENIESLGTITRTANFTMTTNPNKIEITPYFVDDSGKDQICSQTSEFKF